MTHEALSRRLRAAAVDPRNLAAVVMAIVYLLTLFPGVGGTVNRGDSAKFQFMGVIGGVSHPPGNPLYMLFDVAVVHLLPCVEPARVVNALSAVFGLLALVGIGRATTLLTASRLAGVMAMLGVGLGPMFWTFSTEAEVYSLNAALIALMLCHVARHTAQGDRRSLVLALATWIFAFSNHLTVACMAPAFAFLVVVYARRQGPGLARRLESAAGLFVIPFLAGLLVLALYAYVPLRLRAHTPYAELGGELTPRSLWAYMTAQQYRVAFSFPSGLTMATKRMPEMLDVLQRQWLWPSFIAIAWGMPVLARRNVRFFAFLVAVILGFLFFPLTYRIDDIDGFYIPLIVVAGVPFGAAVLTFTPSPVRRAPAVLAGLLALSLAPLALVHLRAVVRQVSGDRLEAEMDEIGAVAWDMPDVVRRVPAKTRFVSPTSGYNGSEELNYYAFADREARAKGITVVYFGEHFTGWNSDWPEVTPRSVASNAGPICTLRPSQALAFRRAGIPMTEIPREPLVPPYGPSIARPTIFCSP